MIIKTNRLNNYLRFLIGYWLPPLLWGLLIFTFSSNTVPAVSGIHWQDFLFKKSVHIAEYAILTLLLFRAFKESGLDIKKAIISSLVITVLYGATDEFHQSFTPGREPRVRDVFIDSLGSTLSLYLILYILPKAPLRVKNAARKLGLI